MGNISGIADVLIIYIFYVIGFTSHFLLWAAARVRVKVRDRIKNRLILGTGLGV